MSTTSTTSALSIAGLQLATPAEVTPEIVQNLYDRLAPESKQRADQLTDIAEAFTKVISLKPQALSFEAYYDAIFNISNEINYAAQPATEKAIKEAKALMAEVPALKSLMQTTENAGTALSLAAAPLGIVAAIASDAKALYNWATTNPAMDAENARRFAVLNVALFDAALAEQTKQYSAMPSTGIAWDGKTSRQESFLWDYVASKFEWMGAAIIRYVPLVPQLTAACMALWHMASSWLKDEEVPNFTNAYEQALATVKHRAENLPDTAVTFDERAQETLRERAARRTHESLRGFFGSSSHEGQLAGVVNRGGKVENTAGQTVDMSAQGAPTPRQQLDNGTVLGSHTLGVARDLAEGAVSAVNPNNYQTIPGYLAGAALVGSAGLGSAQGIAQATARHIPGGRIAQTAGAFLGMTGAGDDMSRFAQINNKWNLFQRLPRIATRLSGDALALASGLVSGATKIAAAAGVEMVNGTVLATGAAAQTIGERVAGGSDALAKAKNFVSTVDTRGPLANVLGRGAKKVLRVFGPVGIATSAAFSANTLAGGTEEERQTETGALALAGTGAGIGFLVAGPVGAAVGGIAGGVVSVSDTVSSKVGGGVYLVGGKIGSAYQYAFGPDVSEKLSELAATQDKTLMKYMDANLDGKLNGEEIGSHLARYDALPESVGKIDRDGDGHVTSHDIYTAMKDGHKAHGVQQALLAEAQTYEARAAAARLAVAGAPSFSASTAHLGSVVSMPDGSAVKPNAAPSAVDSAAGLFAGTANADRVITV